MEATGGVLEYKCPCCGAGLSFGEHTQKLKCEYCDNEFDIESVKVYNEVLHENSSDEFQWERAQTTQWSQDECSSVRTFTCPSCGGEILTDEQTAATFCPYCENPTILPGRLSGGIRPDAVIPFKTTKEDAQKAFLTLCKGKPLLPKMFTQEQRVEKITGMYVPFWLYDCQSSFQGTYRATRTHVWADSHYRYTRTSHYMLRRGSAAFFEHIPMDASKKMENAIMESIEPFDYSQMVDFDTAYLSGFLADKYDVESNAGQERVRQRVSNTLDDMLKSTFSGYATVTPTAKRTKVEHSRAQYVLLPVWMLHTKYRDKTYVFAMNGQTGKMTGTFPICPKRSWAWFSLIGGITAAAMMLVQMLSGI